MAKLSDYIKFNGDFQESVNLYLDLNKKEKINRYIPTKSSADILERYLQSVQDNTMQSTLLIGPYGKGKSHLLLLLLAVLSMDRQDEDNIELIQTVQQKIAGVNESAAKLISGIWGRGRYLPVLVMSTRDDLTQAFIIALNDALKREGLSDLAPSTYYSVAKQTINTWKKEYPDTYRRYQELLQQEGTGPAQVTRGLTNGNEETLKLFQKLYPQLTSGSVFNPLINAEVLPIYKNIADTLVQQCGYEGIYIVFDEFSKYIESQDKKTSGSHMKLLQDMCELANASEKSRVHITFVAHKSIKEYGKYLTTETINQFTGIEGRLKEIYFVTSSKNNYELIQNAIDKEEGYEQNADIQAYFSDKQTEQNYQLGIFSGEFTREDFENIVVKGCFPLSPASAYLLLNVSEKVAQNERTLFTFLSKEEPYSVASFVKEASTADVPVCADLIYDYFRGLFKKDVNNRQVHNVWLQAEYALSQTKDKELRRLLKTLAVIRIVNREEEMPANALCLQSASGVSDIEYCLEKALQQDLILKKESTDCYIFKTRATRELKNEIAARMERKGNKVNISRVFENIFETQYVLPKRYNYKYAMTRYFRFEFMSAEEFLKLADLNDILEEGLFCDGKFLALYSLHNRDYSGEILEKMQNNPVECLVVVYQNRPVEHFEQLKEYEVLEELKKDTGFFAKEENCVLEKELPLLEEDLELEIGSDLERCYGPDSEKVMYYLSGGQVVTASGEAWTDIADKICEEVFYKAVRVNNELINKEQVKTAPIKKVRKNMIERILGHDPMDEYLSGTSADATIYRALFVGTGIREKVYAENVEEVLQVLDAFITSASEERKSVREIVDTLSAPPIGMRKGIMPICLAYAISMRREDVILYFGKKEVALSTEMILNMCESPADYELFISKEDVQKEQYIQALIRLFDVKDRESVAESRISNIVQAMQRWFRSLPQVTKNLKKDSSYWEQDVLRAGFRRFKDMMQDVEGNPYEILFELLPETFSGKQRFEELPDILKDLKSKLNGHFEGLLHNVVKETIRVFDEGEKQNLYHTMKDWYERQSDMAKHGLHSEKITAFMKCIANHASFDDTQFVQDLAYAVMQLHIDSWNEQSVQAYIEALTQLKQEVESLDDSTSTEGKMELSFTGKHGDAIVSYYEPVDDSTGGILRNILSDALEDFSDLSVNEKVAILMEMVEKELK